MTDPAKLFYRQSGPKHMKDGAEVTPRVLIHLCTYPGCAAWGSFLFGARWKDGKPGDARCRAHVHLVNGFFEPLPHDAPATTQESKNAAGDEVGAGDPEPDLGL